MINLFSLAVIGVDEEALYANCLSSKNHEVLSLYEMAEMAGLSTGVITTTRVTHASPAATYAHSASRNWEAEAPDGCKDIGKGSIFVYISTLIPELGGVRGYTAPKRFHLPR